VADLPEWASSIVSRLQRWWAWRRSTATPGMMRGKRTIFGGRASVRARFTWLRSAHEIHPVIQRFADRLRAAGKPFKVS